MDMLAMVKEIPKEIGGVEIEQIVPSESDALGVGNMPWSFCIYLAHCVRNLAAHFR